MPGITSRGLRVYGTIVARSTFEQALMPEASAWPTRRPRVRKRRREIPSSSVSIWVNPLSPI